MKTRWLVLAIAVIALTACKPTSPPPPAAAPTSYVEIPLRLDYPIEYRYYTTSHEEGIAEGSSPAPISTIIVTPSDCRHRPLTQLILMAGLVSMDGTGYSAEWERCRIPEGAFPEYVNESTSVLSQVHPEGCIRMALMPCGYVIVDCGDGQARFCRSRFTDLFVAAQLLRPPDTPDPETP